MHHRIPAPVQKLIEPAKHPDQKRHFIIRAASDLFRYFPDRFLIYSFPVFAGIFPFFRQFDEYFLPIAAFLVSSNQTFVFELLYHL